MEECLNRYGGLVWKIVATRCSNRADAEDIVQEIFLDLWKSAHRFDPGLANESTFVAMIARRKAIDQYRKKQRVLATAPLIEGEEPVSSTGACQIEVSDEASRAREMMNELKQEERSVIEMAVDQGLSQSQISERTNMPLGTVKTHARRGLIQLRKLLLGNTSGAQGGWE